MIYRSVVIALVTCLFWGRSDAQVIEPPDLICVSTQGNGFIALNWSLPAAQCGPFVSYSIYASQTFSGPYTEIAVITDAAQTSYLDNTVNGNNQTWYYYMVSNFNCPGGTQVSSDTLDNLDPLAPLISYATVANGFAEMHWYPSPSPEAFGYIVYSVQGGNYVPIDTVYNGDTSFVDLSVSAASASQSYTLATLDACGHAGTINTLPHNTVFVSATVENCSGAGIATWNAYNNWDGGVQHYKLYASYDGQPAVLVDSTTALTDTFVYNASNVCVYVVAQQSGTGVTSTSNIVCLEPNPENPVTNLFLRNVTVAAPGVARLFFTVDSTSDVLEVFVLRSEDGVEFSSIESFEPPASLAGELTFDDSTALTDLKSYYYRVVMKDNCGGTDTSNKAKTILLNGFAYSNLTNSVLWDPYQNDLDTVLFYNLQRQTAGGWVTISTSPSPIEYEEDVSALVADTGTLCYAVEATALIHFLGTEDTVISRSNELCLDQFIKIGMPNAFVPEGTNNIFKPVLRFTGNKSYQFEVYDRWGGKIFATKNFDEGWDGRSDGKLVPMGAYAYYVLVVDDLGQKTERKGTVLVIR